MAKATKIEPSRPSRTIGDTPLSVVVTKAEENADDLLLNMRQIHQVVTAALKDDGSEYPPHSDRVERLVCEADEYARKAKGQLVTAQLKARGVQAIVQRELPDHPTTWEAGFNLVAVKLLDAVEFSAVQLSRYRVQFGSLASVAKGVANAIEELENSIIEFRTYPRDLNAMAVRITGLGRELPECAASPDSSSSKEAERISALIQLAEKLKQPGTKIPDLQPSRIIAYASREAARKRYPGLKGSKLYDRMVDHGCPVYEELKKPIPPFGSWQTEASAGQRQLDAQPRPEDPSDSR